MLRLMRRAFLCLLALLVFSASPKLQAERLPFRAYTTADGLPHNLVYRIVPDSRGFLWFCTKGGLARFDGYGFTNFGTEQGLPDGGVRDLVETRAGEYWVATVAGLMHFNPKGRPGPSARGQGDRDAAPMFALLAVGEGSSSTGTINVLREARNGTVWVGTAKGLYRIDRAGGGAALQSVEMNLPRDVGGPRNITDVLEDRVGTLWVATRDGLYRRWPDGSSARYTKDDSLPDNDLSDVYEDHAGQLWAATRTAGFFSFSADASHAAPVVVEAFGLKDGLPNVAVNQLFESSDGRFWIATAGLVEFFPHGDTQGRRLRSYTQRNGLSYFLVVGLSEDRDGNLWLAEANGGATKLARDGFITYGRLDGIGNVNVIFEDRAGDLCFKGYVLGDKRGSMFDGGKIDLVRAEPEVFTRIGCFDGHRFEWFDPDAVTKWGWVLERTTIQSRSGEFWFGTAQGLFRFAAADHLADIRRARPLAVYSTRDGLAGSQVYRLFEDSSGSIWISTAGHYGLARWDVHSERVVDLGRSPGLPPIEGHLPRSFGEDASGGIWIGFDDGVSRFAHGAFTHFSAAEGLPAGGITDVHRDRSGRLWLASDRAGLIRVDHAEANRPAFVTYATAQGLTSNALEVIAEDAAGFLYLGGGHGIDRFDPETGRVKHFAAGDGLAPGLVYAGFRDRRGIMWFGTSDGLVRLAPRADSPSVAPRVLVSAIRVGGVAQAVSALGEPSVALADFAPDQNHVEADFVAISYGAGEVLRYQYKLEGSRTDWSAPSAQRTVNLANLASGGYTLLVRALNSEGKPSDPPASVTFVILRPIWLRWWFLTLTTLVGGAMLFAVYRYRVARVLEMAAIRTRIATDLHDDIGANLTRISLLSEVAKQAPGDASLSSIGSIARESVGAMSDIVWAISPNNESLANLIVRMRRHAEEVFTLRDINLTFNAPDAHDAMRLPMDVRRDLLLIFKEVVSNTARHSGCSRVSIDLARRGARLVLEVADDGVGFDASHESTGQGLASLRRRAERMKGTLDIRSGNGAGTTVTLQVPL
jgi:ligand-binding sensor domain-containing protein/two-component sensor histidine kinase